MADGKTLKNLLVYSVADILGKSILLILSPILTRILTPSQYGAIPLLTSIWAILSIIQYGGFDTAFYMFRAQTTDEREREKIRITSSTMGVLFLTSFLLLLSGIALSTNWITQYAGVTQLELIFFLLGLLPSAIAYLAIFIFRYLHLSMPYVRINLISKVFSVVVSVPFMIMTPQQDRLLVMFVVIFVTQMLTLIWVYREFYNLKIPLFERTLFSRSLARKMFIFGIAFFPSSLIYSCSVYVDRIIVGYFSDPAKVAVIGLSVSLASGVLMLKSWFSLVWDPLLIEWLATKRADYYLPKLQRVIPFVSATFFCLAILAKLWATFFIDFIYPAHFHEVAEIIPILILAGGVSVLTLIAIATVVIDNTSRFRIQVNLLALTLNIIVAIWLIPRVGIKGAALGTLTGELVVLISWIFVGKFYLKNLNLDWLTSGSVAVAVLIFVLFYENSFFGYESAPSVIITIGMIIWLLIFWQKSEFVNAIIRRNRK